MDTIVTPVTVITLDSTRIEHSIKADLVARYFPPVVRLVQYDQSLPVIAVSLMQNGQTYTLPSGAAANIRVHKPDSTYVYNPALGCDSTRKIVYFEVTQAMAAANGDGLAIVEIVVDGDIAGTSLITLHFEENPVPEDAIESSDEWETIYELGERIIDSTVTPVSTAAGMTDHDVVYLYTGTESGWNQGHMYYYNGTTWVDAGIAVTDTTLSVAGLAADAKKTGDEIADLKDGLTAVESDVTDLKEDLSNSETDLWAWNQTFDKAREKFNPTDIVGCNYAFHSGYVKGIELAVNAINGNDATIFITDTNRKIICKASKKISANDLVVPVNLYIPTDFYVFVSYSGIYYYNSATVYADKWLGVSFATYGSYIAGETLPDFNNNGRIGFALKVKYLTTGRQIIENENDIHNLSYEDVEIISEGAGAHFSLDSTGVLSSRKVGNTSGCYPCFLNLTDKMMFKVTNNPTWVIVSKDSTGRFVALGFQNAGIIFASFNADGTVIAVDYTQNYMVDGDWVGSEIALRWVDDYFCSIYRNGFFIYKFDVRHTSTTITTHAFGFGMYSNMANGVRTQLLKYNIDDGIHFDSVCVLGDSFTDNTRDALGAGTFYFTRWYEFAKEINHINTVYNYGFGGTCMSPYVSGNDSFYNRMQTMHSEHSYPSAVFVLGGTNDYNYNVPLGSIDDDTTDTFYGTLNKMCDYMVNYFSTADVIFCTPIMRVSPSDGKTETYPANDQTNSNGNTLEQFANAMIETCHKWSLPCFDAYHNSGICPQNRNSMNYAWYMNDGIHPKQNGHREIGMRFGEFAKQFM